MNTSLNAARRGSKTRQTGYHIVETVGCFKVYDGAGRFRLSFATREAAQAYIAEHERPIDAHTVAQVLYSTAFGLALLLWPAPVEARVCPPGYPIPIAHGCRSTAGNGVACDNGYQGTFRRIDGRWIGRCVPGPVAWGQP